MAVGGYIGKGVFADDDPMEGQGCRGTDCSFCDPCTSAQMTAGEYEAEVRRLREGWAGSECSMLNRMRLAATGNGCNPSCPHTRQGGDWCDDVTSKVGGTP